MAKTHEVNVSFRDDQGKGASRRLRHAGEAPAIIYGGGEAPRLLKLTQKDALNYITKEWFYTNILLLKAGDETQKALLRDVQKHPYKPLVMHIDFQRLREDEKVRLRVPLHFLNQEKSPAGKTAGCSVLHELNVVEVSCYPKDLPEFLEVDLGEMTVGQIVHLSQLKLPEGVEVPSLKLGKEHDHAVAIAKMVIVEVEATPAEAAPAKDAKKGGKPAAKAPAAKTAAPAAAAPAKAPAKKK
jgi:large subunit ribosomal protein L25